MKTGAVDWTQDGIGDGDGGMLSLWIGTDDVVVDP